MNVGQKATVTRRFDAAQVKEYADLAGLANAPEHVPEPLLAGLFSYLLGVELPGPGTNYLKQDLEFHIPAKVGDVIAAEVKITRLRPEKSLVDLATIARDSTGTAVCEGRALVYVADVAED